MDIQESNLTHRRITQHVNEGSWFNQTLGDFHTRRVLAWPNEVGFVDDFKRVTNQEFDLMVRRLALSFLERGIQKGDVVGNMLPDCAESIAVNVALAKIGAIIMPLNHQFREQDLAPLLIHGEAKAILAPKHFRNYDYMPMFQNLLNEINGLQHIFLLDSENDDYKDERICTLNGILEETIEAKYQPRFLDVMAPNPNDLHLLLLTSGTTSTPKGVLHTFNTFDSAAIRVGKTAALRPDDVALILYPLFGPSGQITLAVSMANGNRIITMDRFQPGKVLETIEREKVTVLWGISTHLIDLLNHPNINETDFESLRLVYSFGAAVPKTVASQVEEKMQCSILMIWGTSECIAHTSTEYTDSDEVRFSSVGRATPFTTIIAADSDGNPVPAGEIGEFLIKGASNFVGYYRNPELNAEAVDEDGWFHTGDAGTIDEHGVIKILGRIKDMVNRGGASIFPREIEEILIAHPKVKDVAIVAMPDERLGEKCCAYVVPTDLSNPLTFEDIVQYLEGKIAKYKFPEHLEIIEAMPMTDAGKVQKVKLREQIAEKVKKGEVG